MTASKTQPAVVTFSPEPYSVELRERPIPVPRRDEVTLEVAAVGVCGSDLHMWSGGHSWEVNYPCTLGHEFSGTVVAVGKEVTGWKEGDHAVSETAARVDPDSPLTRRGLYNLDPARLGFGAAHDGAMTRWICVPDRILHRVPAGLSLEKAALAEPCAVAYNAVCGNSNVEPGDRVIVLGPGPIGILCAMMARLRGAEVVVVGLEQDHKRLEVARLCGCEVLVGEAASWAREVDGLGADGVIDATGHSASLRSALEWVRPAGWITKVGWGPQPLQYSLDLLIQKNVRLQGSFSHNWPIWERVLHLLATGHLAVEAMIGGVWPLEQWEEAFRTMQSGAIVKAVLVPARSD